MAQMPVDTRLEVEKLIEDEVIIQRPRPYLGMSSIAEKCPRKLFYSFRMCSAQSISARLNRLFQRGHREEAIIQADFRKLGIWHHSDQIEVVDGLGHIKGHIDDILENVPDAPKTPHLGEYKTHNDKSFKELIKKGMKSSKPTHYGQMICYMHKLKLKRGLYVAVNKNDDARYYERISENPEKAEELLERGREIISNEDPPPQIGNSTWFECKWCPHYEICHFSEVVLKNCRTCHYGDICDGGKWECSGHKIELTFEQQKLGCGRYKLLEALK